VNEFVAEYRHYCRNPKCRTKLPTPISNPREAFCPETSCRERFYRLRCYACEEKKPGRLDAHTCGRRKCKNALRQIGTPADSRRVEIASGNAIESSLPEGPKSRLDKWRVLAGEIGENALHCATVPDGEIVDGVPTWDGGSFERIEAQNRRLLKAHFAKAGERAAIQRQHMPLNIQGGYRPNYRVLKLNDGTDAGQRSLPDPIIPGFGYDRQPELKPQPRTSPQLPDDLTIPDFLRR
jgi:hypothetical protein